MILVKFPFLSRRIHRQPSDDDGDGETHLSALDSDAGPEWKWSEAEERLNKALDTGGPYAWAEAVMIELEREAKNARKERGLDMNDHHA
jgi:hypothetical protein